MPGRQKKRNLKAPPGIRRKPGRLPEGRPFDQLPQSREDLAPVDKTGDDLLLKIIVTNLTSCRDIIRFAGTDTRFRRVVIENLPYLYIKLRQVVPYFPDMDFEDTPENNYQKFVRECHNFFDHRGHDPRGYGEYGYDYNGFDREGYDEYGYDYNGDDRRGFYLGRYDLEGYDIDGYDIVGRDREGFSREDHEEMDNIMHELYLSQLEEELEWERRGARSSRPKDRRL